MCLRGVFDLFLRLRALNLCVVNVVMHYSMNIKNDAADGSGLYWQAFKQGLGSVLKEYRELILKLERNYRDNSASFSLTHVYAQIREVSNFSERSNADII